MTAAAAVAVDVLRARLAVALVLAPVDGAAVLAAVGRDVVAPCQVVGPELLGEVVAPLAALSVVDVLAVVDFGGEGPRAEGALDQGVALTRALPRELSAALRGAVVVLHADHAVALVAVAVGGAWLLEVRRRDHRVHLGDIGRRATLTCRELRREASRLAPALQRTLPFVLVSTAVRRLLL